MIAVPLGRRGPRPASARLLLACFLGWGALAPAAASRAQALEAGVAQVDITPPAGFLLEGYPDPNSARIATGVRDPLFARVLILKSGATRLGLVDLDLVNVFAPQYLAQLREAARPDVSNLVVDAIHTHSGPPLDSKPASPVGAWYSAAVVKIAAALHEAAAREVPVRLGVGYGVAFIGNNRLRIEHDGGITWFEKNWTGTPNALVDPTLAVVRIDSLDGRPLAILVNYACHPVIYGPDSRLYSADFPGVMTGVVQQALGGEAVCFYLQGGAGNINPTHAVSSLAQGAVEFCRQAGTELGNAAAQVARRIQTSASATPSLQVAEDTVLLRPRWNAKKWKAARPEEAEAVEQYTKPQYEAPVADRPHQPADRPRGAAGGALCGVPDAVARPVPGPRLPLPRLLECGARLFSHHPGRRLGGLRRLPFLDLGRGRRRRKDAGSRPDPGIRNARPAEAGAGGRDAMIPFWASRGPRVEPACGRWPPSWRPTSAPPPSPGRRSAGGHHSASGP